MATRSSQRITWTRKGNVTDEPHNYNIVPFQCYPRPSIEELRRRKHIPEEIFSNTAPKNVTKLYRKRKDTCGGSDSNDFALAGLQQSIFAAVIARVKAVSITNFHDNDDSLTYFNKTADSLPTNETKPSTKLGEVGNFIGKSRKLNKKLEWRLWYIIFLISLLKSLYNLLKCFNELLVPHKSYTQVAKRITITSQM